MEITNSNDLMEAFVNFRKMGIDNSFGWFQDTQDALQYRPELSQGVFFTNYHLFQSIYNGGNLLIHNFNKEGIVELEFYNRGISFSKISDDLLKVTLDENDLIDLHEFLHEARSKINLGYKLNE